MFYRYVRLNRNRIKGETNTTDCIKSLDTLYDVIFSLVKLMAPFTPFITEYMFKRLVLFQNTNTTDNIESVHYQSMPTSSLGLIRIEVERSVALMQTVIDMGRVMRDRCSMPVKYPVSEIIILHRHRGYLEPLLVMEDYILRELNLRKMTISTELYKYGIVLRAEPDYKVYFHIYIYIYKFHYDYFSFCFFLFNYSFWVNV